MELGSLESDTDWAALLNDGPDSDVKLDFLDKLDVGGLASTPESGGAFSIDDLVQFLMNDDDDLDQNVVVDDFLQNTLLDSDSGSQKDILSTPENRSNEEGSPQICEVVEKVDGEDNDDPEVKKRKRQMRNRDAAVKSRERKKEYVKELEMKNKYYEAECKRLGYMLQYYVAENQALRFSLNHQKAFDASTSKQESAVLLLESLLLGSLLGSMGIIWLVLLLPDLYRQVLRTNRKTDQSLVHEVRRDPGSSKVLDVALLSFLMSKRCRGARSRMKSGLTSLSYVSGEC